VKNFQEKIELLEKKVSILEAEQSTIFEAVTQLTQCIRDISLANNILQEQVIELTSIIKKTASSTSSGLDDMFSFVKKNEKEYIN
jgi:chromosome segregation ATPase